MIIHALYITIVKDCVRRIRREAICALVILTNMLVGLNEYNCR